jgi:hypothetical protein
MEPEISYDDHEGPPLYHILSRMNPLHTLILSHFFFKMHFNIILSSACVS